MAEARLVVAANPRAGRGGAGSQVATALRAAGHVVDALAASDAGALERAIRERARIDPPDAIVVVGGDGTVHLAVNALAKTGVPLGIVGIGTGNDFARCVGLPYGDERQGVARVLDAIADGIRVIDVDAVRASNGRWFGGMLSAGFDAAVNERANRITRLHGTPRYIAAVLGELVRLHARRYRITIDRDVRHLDAVLVTIGNTASVGGGMRLAPDARVDDGLLDLLIATPLSRRQLLRVFPRVFKGTHVTDPHVEIVRGRVITIDTDDKGPEPMTYADGERFGPLPLTLEVVPGALQILS